MKIVVLDGAAVNPGDLSYDILQSFGEVTIYQMTPPELAVERIGDAEIVLDNKVPLDRTVLSACPNLRYIGLFSTGYDVVDTACAAEHGITVTNVPAYSTPGVVQIAFALILHFYSRIDEHNLLAHNGSWAQSPMFCLYLPTIQELSGKTLGLIGFGHIGREMAKVAKAFGMRVLVYNRTHYPAYEGDMLRFVTLDELFSQSDVVSLHCPLTPETRGIVNAERLASMKPSALVINTARGPLVDEQALANALNTHRIAGAGVDVVSREPILLNNPLLSAENCVITPHIAWAGLESRTRLLQAVVSNLEAFLNGNPTNRVC